MTTVREMNDRSPTTQFDQPADRGRRGVADVGALEHRHPWVDAEAGVELAVADVEGHDVGRAALQQAVGEPPGRRADVERPTAGDVDAEVVERGVELLAASTDEPWSRPGDGDPLAGRHQPRRLVGDGPADEDTPVGDRFVGLAAAAGEPPADELGVEPSPDHRAKATVVPRRPRGLSRCATWRPCARPTNRPRPRRRDRGRRLLRRRLRGRRLRGRRPLRRRPLRGGLLRRRRRRRRRRRLFTGAVLAAGGGDFFAAVFFAAVFFAAAFLAGAFFAAVFFAAVFFAAVFFAAVFFAAVFFAAVFFAAVFFAAVFFAAAAASRAGTPRRRARARRQRLELVLDLIDTLGQPAELLGDLGLDRLGQVGRRLLPPSRSAAG